MQFRTKVEIPKSKLEINHSHKIAMIGSCFTQNIGDLLKEHSFSVSVNPYGILFNPISVAKAIKTCVKQTFITEKDLLQVGEQWVSLFHHSQFNSLTAGETVEKINNAIAAAKQYYTTGDYLLITLGSAWVYEYNETAEIVANCHKIPNQNFTKRLLSVHEIVTVYTTLFLELQQVNPNLKIVFTISPVRHWKDGVIENNRSKAVLQLVCMELTALFEEVSYFPAYEIVLDELRDYRFYKTDMLHPNELAVAYIYDRFMATYFSEHTARLTTEISKLKQALAHRPFNPNGEEYQLFLQQIEAKVTAFKLQNPTILL